MTSTSEVIRGVDFVGFPTRDLAAAVSFYGESLGLPRSVYNEERSYAEFESGRLPQGFGFSDTAFRIFILMASRRLNSDRFFTTDYNPQVYSQVGFDWVVQNDMTTVLLRHFPKLKPMLDSVKNPFAPWPKAKV